MSEETKVQETPDDLVTWSYQVLDGYIEAFNHVMACDPAELNLEVNKLKIEFVYNIPLLFEALAYLTKPEHRPMLHKFFESGKDLIKSWAARKKPRR